MKVMKVKIGQRGFSKKLLKMTVSEMYNFSLLLELDPEPVCQVVNASVAVLIYYYTYPLS